MKGLDGRFQSSVNTGIRGLVNSEVSSGFDEAITAKAILDKIHELDTETQDAVLTALDAANKALGVARAWLQEAAEMAGIDKNNS